MRQSSRTQYSSGVLAVKPYSECAITNLASDVGFASSTILENGTPSHFWSSRDQVVTQCMSAVTAVCSSFWNSSQLSLTSFSTLPNTRKSQVFGLKGGTGP